MLEVDEDLDDVQGDPAAGADGARTGVLQIQPHGAQGEQNWNIYARLESGLRIRSVLIRVRIQLGIEPIIEKICIPFFSL